MGAFCRFYDKTFATLCAAIENKSIIKALPQPFLFCNTLLAGHGAADMFLVNILFCDPNIVHPLFLQCCQFCKKTLPNLIAVLKWLLLFFYRECGFKLFKSLLVFLTDKIPIGVFVSAGDAVQKSGC